MLCTKSSHLKIMQYFQSEIPLQAALSYDLNANTTFLLTPSPTLQKPFFHSYPTSLFIYLRIMYLGLSSGLLFQEKKI